MRTWPRRMGLALLALLALLIVWLGLVFIGATVIQTRIPISLPIGPNFYATPGYAVAEGTWIMGSPHKQAFPVQTSRVECVAQEKTCRMSTAEISIGDTLRVQTYDHQIREWTDSSITFVDDSPVCAHYIYTINFAAKSASGVRTKKNGPACEQMEKEVRLVLTSGFDVIEKLRVDAEPWYFRLAVAPFRNE